MRKAAAALLSLAIALAAGAQDAAPRGGTMEESAAFVDGRLVTARDLNYAVFELRLGDPVFETIPDETLRRTALAEAVDEALLVRWAETVITDYPAEAVRRVADEQFAQYLQWAGSEELLELRLAEAGLSMRGLRQYNETRARGVFLVRLALAATMGPDALPPEDDSPSRATRVRLAAIHFVPKGRDERARLEAQERALMARREIVSGFPFARAAQLYSDDPASGVRGGDAGWMDASALAPELRERLGALRDATSSDPVFLGGAWQLVRLLDYDTEERRAWRERYAAGREARLLELRANRPVRFGPGYGDAWKERLRRGAEEASASSTQK
ncbi:MAG: peptidylprolyl isomerase [Candidatus Sumerlaeia bacterium]|nr:peptidylprolyl isomerase [Candidatus Sumerlaeia bacterium]